MPGLAFLIAAAAYLLGSIPFGLVLTRIAGLGDIRNIGSGNIGATNVLRTGRKGLAAATLILDGAKGAAAVLIARHFSEDLALIAGGAAFLGHLFPVWLKFRGGKGVATALGVLLALSWPVGLIVAGIWLFTALTLRISSLSALVAAASAPVATWFVAGHDAALLALFLAGLIFIRHHENIRRLLAGTESRIGEKKKAAAACQPAES